MKISISIAEFNDKLRQCPQLWVFTQGVRSLAVATRNNKRVGPESSVFWDQIKWNYPMS